MTYSYTALPTNFQTHHRDIASSPYGVSVHYRGLTLSKFARSMRLANVAHKRFMIDVKGLCESLAWIVALRLNKTHGSAIEVLITGFLRHAVTEQLSVPFIMNLLSLYMGENNELPYPCNLSKQLYMSTLTARNVGKSTFAYHAYGFNTLVTVCNHMGDQCIKSTHRQVVDMRTLDRWLKRYRTHETCPRTKAFIDEMLTSTIWASDIKSGKFLVPERDVQSEYVLTHSTTLLSGHTVDHYAQPIVSSNGVPCEDKTGDYTVAERSLRGIAVWPSHDNEGNSLGETFPIPPNIKV